jgi:hypothetical protein
MTMFRKEKAHWRELDPALAPKLSNARLQLHHAAQFVACMGISYLPKAEDDSHTNMEWINGTLAGHVVGPRPFRLAVRPHPLALVVIVGDVDLASFALGGRTIADGAGWIRAQARSLGLDPARYSLAKHYTIPTHPVDRGVPFDTSDARAFEQLALWYSNANLAFAGMADDGGSPVRCWPHHFDIATLLTIAPGKTVGVGLEPGDVYYDEPYWYVNSYPAPAKPPTARLEGGGSWHTHEWTGAVLPGSRLSAGDQRAQVERFLNSAIEASS